MSLINDYDNLNWSYKDQEKSRKQQHKYDAIKRKEILKQEKRKYKNEILSIKKQAKVPSRMDKFTTTKLFMYVILINCILVEGYSMAVMYMLKDLSALYSLIGAVITQSISFAIYCVKSHTDTKEEVKSRLERDKFEAEINSEAETTDNTSAEG